MDSFSVYLSRKAHNAYSHSLQTIIYYKLIVQFMGSKCHKSRKHAFIETKTIFFVTYKQMGRFKVLSAGFSSRLVGQYV